MKTTEGVLLLILFLMAHSLQSQDIESRLSGNTTSQGFTVRSNNGASLFTIRGDGRVGLGTTSPDTRLHVNGQLKLTGGSPGLGKVLTSDADGLASWEQLPFSLSGTGTAQRIGFWNGTYSLSSHAGFVFDTTSVRLGIGTGTPDATLHVSGQVKITGGSPGSGKVLTSDVDGLATWATPSSSGCTLDQAYDFGGAGAGRIITADAGAVSIAGTDGLVATGLFGSGGSIPVSGTGTRMIWYPKKASFRAGYASSTEWDDTNIGNYSIALGYAVGASGFGAIALGAGSYAQGENSTAISGGSAYGTQSIAMGGAVASGDNCVAIGGVGVNATGNNSIAIGTSVTTNNKAGTFVFGDISSAVTNFQPALNNRFYARFANGYEFYTNSGASIGVKVDANQNSWSSISDSTRKELLIVRNGEMLLTEFRELRLGSWNYKGQDHRLYRHYGPIAQEWFAAFGHDGIGTIGNDTTLASADVDGVLCIAVQALEKRTAADREQLSVLTEQNRSLLEQLNAQNEEIAELREQISTMCISVAKGNSRTRCQIAEMREHMKTIESRIASMHAEQKSAMRDFVSGVAIANGK